MARSVPVLVEMGEGAEDIGALGVAFAAAAGLCGDLGEEEAYLWAAIGLILVEELHEPLGGGQDRVVMAGSREATDGFRGCG
jgi:hypothetical protein